MALAMVQLEQGKPWSRVTCKDGSAVEKRVSYALEICRNMRPLEKGGATNARLYEMVWTRAAGDGGEGRVEKRAEDPAPKVTDGWGRRDLAVRLKTASGSEQVLWYHLCWFYLSGQTRFRSWSAFKQRGDLEVDHGSGCMDPLQVNFRMLDLKRKGGRGGNASQGASIRERRRASESVDAQAARRQRQRR